MYVNVIKKDESVIYNGVIYRHGQSFDAEETIAKSLIERGYVAAFEEVDEADVLTGHLDKDQLSKMSVSELRRLAAQMELDVSGKKTDLIARICAEEVFVEPEAVVDEDPDGEASGDLPQTDMPE